ncbi:MAG: hypothetical protein LBS20_19510 [Prevotella sp.]|jgi:hypothetical protein|nr:hypothetical protein [Prevotella sp.]
MNERLIRKITSITGRRASECSCEECRNQCRTPCLGTPDDILRLIEAGYADKLAFTHWAVGMMLGKLPLPIPMVQILKTENGCVFFKNGLCELHNLGLKPTEGRLSHHEIKLENYIFGLSLTWNVAKQWIEEENFGKIIRVFVLKELLK